MASKSVGQIAGTVIGAAVGFFAGGNVALGASIGGMIGGMIDPPKGPTVVGPRLDDLSFQTSTLGAPLGRAYGTVPVLGNVVWLEGDKYREVITSEEQGGKGGSTSTYETAHYYATFAVSLLRVPDATQTVALRRLWIGSNLVYDAGSDNLDSIIASNLQSTLFSFYSGADDQQPNTRLQADKGANAVSGFPGRCYIVIYDLDLEPYSRSLAMAQVKAELVVSQPSVEVDLYGDLQNTYDVTGTVEDHRLCSVSIDSAGVSYGMLRINSWTNIGNGAMTRRLTLGESDVVTNSVDLTIGTGSGVSNAQVRCAQAPDGETPVFVISSKSGTTETRFIRFDGVNYQVGEYIGPAEIEYGRFWVLAATSSGFFIADTSAAAAIRSFNGVALAGSSSVSVQASDIGYSDNYVFVIDAVVSTSISCTVKRFNISDLSLDATYTQSVPGLSGGQSYLQVVGDDEFFVRAGTNCSHWIGGVATSLGNVFGPHSASGVNSPTWFRIFSLSPFYAVTIDSPTSQIPKTINVSHAYIPASPASLRDVVTSECGLAGVSAADIDLTGLTDSVVRGFRIANSASIRSSLEMLQAAFPFDVAPSGYKLRFVSRGGASLATIPGSDLGAIAGGDSLPVLLPSAREMDTQIPYKVSVRYLDPAREYDIGEQYASRPDTASVSERTVELSLVMTGDEAARAADVLNQKDWIERTSFGPFTLPPTWNELEPPDVVTVEHRGQAHTLRLTRAETLPDGRIVCSGVPSSAQSYTSTATAQESLTIGQSLVPLKGSTSGFLLDIPRIRSEQDVPGMSFALTGLASGWPGGVLLRSDDSGNSWPAVGSVNSRARVFTAGLQISSHHGYSVDHASVLTVTPHYSAHTLASVTETQFYAHSNLAAYGIDGRWEIVAFKTVVDNTGSYTVRDFLRGLYGTEQHTGTHAAGDYFILLDTATVSFFGLPTNAIGAARLYRAITQGAVLDSAADVTDTYDANNLKPLSPVDINGNRNPSSFDWTVTFARRTRQPVELFSGASVPLGETVESYDVEAWNSDYSALKRTFPGLTSASLTYTAAQQISDFGGAYQSTLYLRVYQNSSVVGRGFPLQTSIYRNIKTDGSGYSATVLSFAPLLYYKMDGNTTTITDSGSAASNGTASATNVTYQQTALLTGGTPGYSIKFTTGYISAPHLAGMNGAYTIIFHMQPTALPAAESGFLHKGDAASAGNQGHYISLMPDGKVKLNWYNGSWRAVTTAAAVFSAGVTAHIAITYNGTTGWAIYRNGSLFEAFTLTNAFVNNAQAFIINGSKSTSISGLSSTNTLDDFAWFNSQLSAATIGQIYEAS